MVLMVGNFGELILGNRGIVEMVSLVAESILVQRAHIHDG